MKKLLFTIGALAITGFASVQAGPMYVTEKNPIAPVAPVDLGCPCYGPGFELGGFVAGIFPDNGSDEEIGGGISLAWFFNENLGVEVGYAVFDTDTEEHVVSGSLVYRFPMANCWSPYVMAGGSVYTNGDTFGAFHVGGGIEYRFENWNCIGIFVDGTYNWAAEDEWDGPIARAGVRIPF